VTDRLYYQGQFSYLSDKNFLEQFFKQEFDTGPNQETFGYLTWQDRNYGASALLKQRVGRDWMTDTNWLPRVDGTCSVARSSTTCSCTARGRTPGTPSSARPSSRRSRCCRPTGGTTPGGSTCCKS
jgi:hypothetical protein